MHKLYSSTPPHERSLYDTLGVKPNATMAEITKAYRRKSRNLHPDKRRSDNPTVSTADSNNELKRVREAYEVLKEDSTRLPYHKFGLIDTNLAAMLLTGGKASNNDILNTESDLNKQLNDISPEQNQLLQWMGYSPHIKDHEQRLVFIVTNLVETIRPLVEDIVSQDQLAHQLAMQCDVLKSLPLGSQIIRCIGRAYRHSGQAYLNKYSISNHNPDQNMKRNMNKDSPMKMKIDFKSVSTVLGIGKKWRKGKDLMDAAVTTGKLLYVETKEKRRRKRNKQQIVSDDHLINYHNLDYDLDSQIDLEDEVGAPSTDDEIQETERSKAQSALIHTLQIEALWKISKIELDQTIQESCKLLLSGDYFFFPSHFSRARIMGGAADNDLNTRDNTIDGWVGGSGQIVDSKVGRLRAAAALVLIGDVLVQCSKEGTSWID